MFPNAGRHAISLESILSKASKRELKYDVRVLAARDVEREFGVHALNPEP